MASATTDGELEWMKLKQKGNDHFRSNNFREALKLYTIALSFDVEDSGRITLLNNQTACNLSLERYEDAICSANEALKFDPGNVKALFRRARAKCEVSDLDGAQEDVDTLEAMGMGPNKDVQALAGELRKKRKEGKNEKSELSFETFMKGKAPNPAAWSNGLSNLKRYEWLVDCYRMRVDDECVWQGELRVGSSYDPDFSPDTLLVDFLIFCKVALNKGVIPTPWDWDSFLKTAADSIRYAFEKSDAQEKWGSENVFQGILGIGNGRSLRYTAEIVYGTSVNEPHSGWDEQCDTVQDAVQRRCFKNGISVNFSDNELFSDIGGMQPWKKLLKSLRSSV